MSLKTNFWTSIQPSPKLLGWTDRVFVEGAVKSEFWNNSFKLELFFPPGDLNRGHLMYFFLTCCCSISCSSRLPFSQWVKEPVVLKKTTTKKTNVLSSIHVFLLVVINSSAWGKHQPAAQFYWRVLELSVPALASTSSLPAEKGKKRLQISWKIRIDLICGSFHWGRFDEQSEADSERGALEGSHFARWAKLSHDFPTVAPR